MNIEHYEYNIFEGWILFYSLKGCWIFWQIAKFLLGSFSVYLHNLKFSVPHILTSCLPEYQSLSSQFTRPCFGPSFLLHSLEITSSYKPQVVTEFICFPFLNSLLMLSNSWNIFSCIFGQFLNCLWKVKVAQSCLTFCNPMDYTVHGILQARILEWVAFAFFRGSSQPRDWTQVSCIAGEFFTSWAISRRLILYHLTPWFDVLVSQKFESSIIFLILCKHVLSSSIQIQIILSGWILFLPYHRDHPPVAWFSCSSFLSFFTYHS